MTPRQLSAASIAGFLAVAVAGIALRPLLPIDETRYLAVAWEMWLSGDYLVPTRNFEIYTHKPPLLFWLVNLVWSVVGVSETAARLVGPAAAALTLGLTGVLAHRLWPEDAGIGARATGALAGMLTFSVYGGLTMFDALLSLTTVATMLALVAALRSQRPVWWVVVGATIGLGALAKGPVILIHTVPAMLAVPLWAGVHRPPEKVLAGRIALALAVGTGVVALWVIPAAVAGGAEYRHAILWTQSAGRIVQAFDHARPWWFLPALLPLILFPWVFLPALWRAAWRARWSEPGLVLAVVWGLSGLIAFSLISGKQLHYLLPELPAAALIVARLARGLTFRPVVPAAVVTLLALGAVAAWVGLIPLSDTEGLIRPAPMLPGFGLVLLGFCWLALRAGGLAGTVLLSLGVILSANLLIGLTSLARVYDSRGIAGLLSPHARQGIAVYGQTYQAEFNFAARQTVRIANPESQAELAQWIGAHPGGVILARTDRAKLPWQPRQTINYRNTPYAIWHTDDAPQPVSAETLSALGS